MRMMTTAAIAVLSAALFTAAPLGVRAATSTGHASKPVKQSITTAATETVLGTLGNLSATSADIMTPGSTVPTTVTLTASTRYLARSQTAAVAGLKSTDAVAAIGRQTTSGLKVTVLEYDTVAFGVAVRYTGRVTSATATTLVLNTTGTTTVTFTVTSATHFIVNGKRVKKAPTTFPSNMPVSISAQQMTSGGFIARTVIVGPRYLRRA